MQNWTSISTHASLAGRDDLLLDRADDGAISTHASLAGRDGGVRPRFKLFEGISTHASLAGRDGKYCKGYL